jgi:hypothetical protein
MSASDNIGMLGAQGSAGGAGGQTKFGSMLIINGGSGGKGGNIGTYNYQLSTDCEPPAQASGGSGGAMSTSSLCHVIHTYAAVSGSKSAAGTCGDGHYRDGMAGGSASRTILNRSSGAGGAGGRTSSNYYSSYPRTDGTAGGGGSCGYMRIIW